MAKNRFEHLPGSLKKLTYIYGQIYIGEKHFTVFLLLMNNAQQLLMMFTPCSFSVVDELDN